MWETWVRSLCWEDPLEKGKATHFSILNILHMISHKTHPSIMVHISLIFQIYGYYLVTQKTVEQNPLKRYILR